MGGCDCQMVNDGTRYYCIIFPSSRVAHRFLVLGGPESTDRLRYGVGCNHFDRGLGSCCAGNA